MVETNWLSIKIIELLLHPEMETVSWLTRYMWLLLLLLKVFLYYRLGFFWDDSPISTRLFFVTRFARIRAVVPVVTLATEGRRGVAIAVAVAVAVAADHDDVVPSNWRSLFLVERVGGKNSNGTSPVLFLVSFLSSKCCLIWLYTTMASVYINMY